MTSRQIDASEGEDVIRSRAAGWSCCFFERSKGGMKQFLSDILPAGVKSAISRSSFYNVRAARHLAGTSKRIDICSAQIAHLLNLACIGPVRGMVCLEVGAGWLLSHALVFHLLGAKKVITTDIVPHAQPGVLHGAVKQAVAALPRDILAPFEDHSLVRERMNNLMSIRKFSFDTLKNLGIEYMSPVDLAREKLDVRADLIYSLSVLEHVPCDDVGPLLRNLAEMLSPGGVMLHAIHLEDHRDFGQPFAFLSLPGESYTRHQQSGRGNRLRASEWDRLFSETPGTSTKTLYTYHRRDRALPREIDRSVRYVDEEDLRVSHVGTLTRKIG